VRVRMSPDSLEIYPRFGVRIIGIFPLRRS
jgi:hypothetical protein